jgi:hypothetical protein
MRAVRAMSELKHLRAFLVCLQGSFMSFFWSLVMLVAVLVIFSLFMVQLLGAHLLDNHSTLEGPVESMFGSVMQSTLTLFKASTGGRDWAIAYEVISQTGWMGSMIYLMFIAFTQLALINIITGIFVESAVQTLRPDRETIVTEQLRLEREHANELEKLCCQVDKDGNGKISPDEFEKSLERGGRIPKLLLLLGLSRHHVIEFFQTLSHISEEEDGEVDIATFVTGCMQLKGAATNFDVQMLHAELKGALTRQDKAMLELHSQIASLQRVPDFALHGA